jgi:hypothetical protein
VIPVGRDEAPTDSRTDSHRTSIPTPETNLELRPQSNPASSRPRRSAKSQYASKEVSNEIIDLDPESASAEAGEAMEVCNAAAVNESCISRLLV